MDKFIIALYENANFPIYLGIIIGILMLAFFIVLFLGKKDKKKIEQTQRLQAITADAFKETTAPTKVEVVPQVVEQTSVAEVQENQTVNSAIAVETPVQMSENQVVSNEENIVEQSIPPVDEIPVVAPAIEPPVVPEVPVPPVLPIIPEESEKEIARFNPEPEIEPYIPEVNLDNFATLADSIDKELTALEKQQEIAKPIIGDLEVAPTFDEMPKVIDTPVVPAVAPVISEEKITPILTEVTPEPIKVENQVAKPNPTKVVDVFSSVYIPPKKEVLPSFDDTMEIELPKLKDSNM